MKPPTYNGKQSWAMYLPPTTDNIRNSCKNIQTDSEKQHLPMWLYEEINLYKYEVNLYNRINLELQCACLSNHFEGFS